MSDSIDFFNDVTSATVTNASLFVASVRGVSETGTRSKQNVKSCCRRCARAAGVTATAHTALFLCRFDGKTSSEAGCN